ncbi:MAG: type II toxin-antitoxin system VapC family toxin [Nitrosomonadales bacterium]|nr:type II toxin-antitoxin system VapC family toxin [Nitrosomonadales bacterium]
MSGILLDTNVLSELMRPKPAAEVLDWFERQQGASFFVSAITRAEILLGIALLPAGKRRNSLAAAAEQMFNEDFAGHSLAFDGNCATEYALLVAERVHNGHTISTEDGQIAAIALSHNQPLATRNGKDFKGIKGLTLLNPWK